jgi:hypothetical protein
MRIFLKGARVHDAGRSDGIIVDLPLNPNHELEEAINGFTSTLLDHSVPKSIAYPAIEELRDTLTKGAVLQFVSLDIPSDAADADNMPRQAR